MLSALAIHEGEAVLGASCACTIVIGHTCALFSSEVRAELYDAYLPVTGARCALIGSSVKLRQIVCSTSSDLVSPAILPWHGRAARVLLQLCARSQLRIAWWLDAPTAIVTFSLALQKMRSGGGDCFLLNAQCCLTIVVLVFFGLGSHLRICFVTELRQWRLEATASGDAATVLRLTWQILAVLPEDEPVALELKEVGFCARDLLDEGFSAHQLWASGFSASDLLEAGLSKIDLEATDKVSPPDPPCSRTVSASSKRSNVTFVMEVAAGDLDTAEDAEPPLETASGPDAAECVESDVAVRRSSTARRRRSRKGRRESRLPTPGTLLRGSVTEDVSELKGKDPGQLRIDGANAFQLKEAGFTVPELKQAGFDAEELKDASFDLKELRQAGFALRDLYLAGFTAGQAKQAGFDVKEMRNAGFRTSQLNFAGFKAERLKGFDDARALRDRNFSAEELKESGYDAEELREAGFDATTLKDVGFIAEDLAVAGFEAAELRDAGFNVEELLDAGLEEEELASVGYDAREVRRHSIAD